ncbi:hypothetical protein HN587_01325 [Candidatus Woesearchaeota archaeon]|jgi:replication factor A1|nr:hypothetical protein [Candidatus Woesearchaeota archaeon]
MKIKELEPKQGNVEVQIKIKEMGDIREFEKFGKTGRVANAIAMDETGEIKLSLWNEQIDQIKAGDTVLIKNGYVNEWKGELQLTTGRAGSMEVVSSGDSGSHILTDDEKTEEEILYEQKETGGHVMTKDEKTEEEVLCEKSEKPSIEESATSDELDIEEEKI